VERTEPPLAARSRRTRRPWVRAAPSSPSAGGLPTSNPRCSVRAYLPAHCRSLQPDSRCPFPFSSLAAPAPAVAGEGAARHFGAGAFVSAALYIFFWGFCCSFPRGEWFRGLGFRRRWSRRSRWNPLRPPPIRPAGLFLDAQGRSESYFRSGRLSLISTGFSAWFDEFVRSR
jgi:hypothetical protein